MHAKLSRRKWNTLPIVKPSASMKGTDQRQHEGQNFGAHLPRVITPEFVRSGSLADRAIYSLPILIAPELNR